MWDSWAHCTAAQTFWNSRSRAVDGELVRVAILADGLPGDMLHDEVGKALGRCARFEQRGDIVVVQRLEDPALVVKPAQNRIACPCRA